MAVAALPQSSHPGPTSLAVARFIRGLSQRQLAAKSGVSERTIVYLEQGQHRPRKTTAQRLGSALRLDAALLFPLNDQRPAANPGAGETSTADVGGHHAAD